MRYRKLGKINEEISILGSGCMRLPQKNGKIDEIESTKMLKLAIDNGINYIDTAYIYKDEESYGLFEFLDKIKEENSVF